jgi:hypothetical protein
MQPKIPGDALNYKTGPATKGHRIHTRKRKGPPRFCAAGLSVSGGLMERQYPWTPNPKLTPGWTADIPKKYPG